MKETSANRESERFQRDVGKYSSYLATPEGRLRIDLAFASLQDLVLQRQGPICALDIGCGTGALAIRLAQRGVHVTLFDSSAPMLGLAEQAARDAELTGNISLKHGDAARLTDLLNGKLFDLIICHNVLEYVDDPGAIVRNASRALRDSSSVVSVLVRNQAGEVVKAAIRSGDLTAAERNLTAEWGSESLYGGSVRLFSPASLHAMLRESSLTVSAECGIRILSDYLPPQISRENEYERIFTLERKLGIRPEFVGVARYIQCLATRPGPGLKDAA